MPPPHRYGPRRRRGSALYGGTPTPPPLVSTVGVNNLTATTANLVGSINPLGLSGSWWFVYGTTPQYGNTSSVTAVSATSLPQTETLTVTGLTTGATYYFAMVGKTTGGTLTASPLQFVAGAPAPIPDPTDLPAPSGTPLVSVPHYQYPIKFSATNGISVVEQDTLDEVFSCAQAVVACQVGACPELPTFGIPDPTFGQAPLDTSAVVAAVQKWEPRAQETAVSAGVGDPDLGTWKFTLTTGYAEGGS